MLRCVAIDDEPIALTILERYCQKHGGIMLETFTSPNEGVRRIEEWKPEIVMLDIEMNGASGLEIARNLPPGCLVIFTTAYAYYALDGFNVNALDFLHKPFFYKRFCRAIEKAEQWLHMAHLLQGASSQQRQIVLKCDYKKVPVSIDTIEYIESIGNYVRLHLSDSSTLMSKTTLANVVGMLPTEEFLRIHRSFVVAKCRIGQFSHTQVVIGAKSLPIGKKYAKSVVEALQKP